MPLMKGDFHIHTNVSLSGDRRNLTGIIQEEVVGVHVDNNVILLTLLHTKARSSRNFYFQMKTMGLHSLRDAFRGLQFQGLLGIRDIASAMG